MNIWGACEKKVRLCTLRGEVYRVVESQEQIATSELVDNFEEQALLENLLDTSKPGLPENRQHLHYLLTTPFRYPPLKYGSRFGTRIEPSLFYASRNSHTALAETAFYRAIFWHHMEVSPPSAKLTTQHILFTTRIFSKKGLKLQNTPFKTFQSELTDKNSYMATQPLGTAMRESGVEAFETVSARDTEKGLNVALFYPGVIKGSEPSSIKRLICHTQEAMVEFIDENNEISQFEMNPINKSVFM